MWVLLFFLKFFQCTKFHHRCFILIQAIVHGLSNFIAKGFSLETILASLREGCILVLSSLNQLYVCMCDRTLDGFSQPFQAVES